MNGNGPDDQSFCKSLAKKFCIWVKYSNLTSFTREASYPAYTMIENHLLALFNIVCKLLLIAYLLWAFFYERLYFKLAVPKINTLYYTDKTEDTYTPENFSYCSNSTYDFRYDVGWDYSDADCVSLIYGEAYSRGERNFFFFPTFIQTSSEARLRNCTTDDEIFEDSEFLFENCTFTADGSDIICDCYAKKNYMVMGVEDRDFLITLSYFVSEFAWTGITGDSDVRVIVKGHEDNVVGKYSDVDYISYTVGEWLEAAGVNLDEPNLSVTSLDGSFPTNPFWRTTGVILMVDVQLYNLPSYHGVSEWEWQKVFVVNVNREEGWGGYGSRVMWLKYPGYYFLKNDSGTGEYFYTNSYPYGVNFIFHHSGYIGKTDRTAIQEYFIHCLVLIAVIPKVIAYLGMWIFGFNSEIYREQLRHHPDGIVRDMEFFFETFKFLFQKYMEKKSSRSSIACSSLSAILEGICPYICGISSSASNEVVTAQQFAQFCSDREIERKEVWQMWSEINNDPYLASKTFFTSKTLWNAIRSNYDKVAERVNVETTLIRRMWKKWDEEYLTTKMMAVGVPRVSTQKVAKEVIELMKKPMPGTKVTVERVKSSLIKKHGARRVVKL